MSFAMKQYARIGTQASIQDASPHRLIQMLFRGALDRMAGARVRWKTKTWCVRAS